MTLVPSLLQAIVLMDGEALVLHVGDKPYVVAESGQVSLANTHLTAEAISDVIDELLPAESRRVFEDVGATQCVLPEYPQFPDQRFSVVAARGGDDVWLEIRRVQHQATPNRSAPPRPEAPPPDAPARRAGDEPRRQGTSAGRVVEPAPPPSMPDTESHAAVVLPLTRTPVRADVPPPLAESALSGLDRLLRLAAARGASTLYVVSGARPSIRIDGEVRTLDGAPAIEANEVEALLLTLMPERSAEALRSGAASEWTSEFDDLGRVRCLGFRDHRGPGGVFRIMPQRAVTTEQLGLSREIQALAGESEGLIVVTGPRLSGKRTLMSAFVDHVNRTRHAHIITIERDINIVHERAGSMVSQREVHGSEQMAGAVRSALREDPDVLMLEDVRSAELADLALDAAAAGRLVICGFPARSAAAAIDGIIDLSPPSERRRVQLALAQNLRGVVAQVLLKKTGGGRLAARELLLNTPTVAGLLAEGKTSQLPLAIEGGRKHGMVPLNDALGGFAQSGAVDVREAYRCSADRPGLLALLQKQGVDVSQVERFA
ncbi:MAG TPA: ATPase, T2SS/T4P/T4SS family [Vicinamibacterales bacterium]|nr:ATPase, T2SS/T4P/T4SS family [Vicinamibacterales bacterium]